MALIRCPECGKQISNRAEVCIHCGYPIQKYSGGSSGYQENYGSYPNPASGGYGRYPNQQAGYSQQGNNLRNPGASYSAGRNNRPSGTSTGRQYIMDDYGASGNSRQKNWKLRGIIGVVIAILCVAAAVLLVVYWENLFGKPENPNPESLPTMPVATDSMTKPPAPTIPPAGQSQGNPTQPPAPTEPAGSNQDGFTHPPAPTQPTNDTQEIPLFNYTDNG